MAGSLLVPLCYLLLQELGLCAWTGAIAGFMIIFGKLLCFQYFSRYSLKRYTIWVLFLLMLFLLPKVLNKISDVQNMYLINFLFTDNAILTQSRFILMESIMMCFGVGALLSVLKFKKVSNQPFTSAWFFWLCASTFLATAAFR